MQLSLYFVTVYRPQKVKHLILHVLHHVAVIKTYLQYIFIITFVPQYIGIIDSIFPNAEMLRTDTRTAKAV